MAFRFPRFFPWLLLAASCSSADEPGAPSGDTSAASGGGASDERLGKPHRSGWRWLLRVSPRWDSTMYAIPDIDAYDNDARPSRRTASRS